MSDVSGIPNLGFGGGNFFAPQFSYNPQINPTAGYAGPANYAQNVQDNAIRDVQYDQKLFQHYYEQSLGGVVNTTLPPEEPGHFTDYNAGGPWPTSGGSGGGSASPYQTSNNVFDTGASPFQGGGGSSGMGGSIYGNMFPGGSSGGGLFSGNANSSGGGGYSGPTIDWSGVGNAAAGMGASSGGARSDPSPGMAMPGGLGSPMTVPQQQQQPGINWGDVGAAAGAGSSMPYTSGIEPDQSAQTFAGGAAPADPFPGMSMPGGLNSPMTTPEPGASFGERFDASGGNAPGAPRTYDFAPMFEGGGGGFGSGGTESQTYGKNAGSLGGNVFDYIQDPSAAKEAPGPSAEDMAAQGRARLAELMGGTTPEQAAETTKAVEDTSSTPSMADFASPEQGYSDFQKAATPRTGYDADLDFLGQRGAHNSKMRPGGTGLGGIDEHIQLSEAGPYKSLSPELAARLRAVGEAYEAATGKRANYGETARGSDVQKVYWDRYQSGEGGLAASPENSRHRQGNAMDIPRGDFRDWAARNGAQFGIVFPFSNDIVHVQMSPSYQGPNFVRPPADIPYPQGIPMPAERPAEAPARPFAAPPEQGQGVNAGQDIPRPPADIPQTEAVPAEAVPLPTARPAAANIAQANSVLDSKVLDLVRQNSPGNVDRIPSSIANQTLREALGNTMTGGMIRSGLTPYLPQMGVTQAEFDKAYAGGRSAVPASRFFGDDQSITNQPLAPGELNANWNKFIYEATDRPTMARNESLGADPNPFTNFRQSSNVDDRRFDPQLTDEQRQANPYTGGRWTFDPKAPIPEGGSMGEALGTRQIDNLEANVTAQRMAGQGASAAPRLADLPFAPSNPVGPNDVEKPQSFESMMDQSGYTPSGWSKEFKDAPGAEDATFKERYWPQLEPDNTTGMRDFQSPEQGYSAFQQPASRDALAKTMNFSGFSPSPETRQGGVGPQAELTPEFMDVIKQVESSGNPKEVTGSYKGLYQLDDKEFRKYGGKGDIFDPEENTKAASAKMIDENQRVQDRLGRALTPPEQYMVHQQGVAGALAHLANPDELAWKNFQGAAGSSEARAKDAIWKNMTPEMQKQFGNDVNNVTSRDFLRLWDDRYYGVLNR